MPLPASLRLLIAAAALAVLAPARAGACARRAPYALASHRAVYDLKLSTTRGKRSMNAVRGRILYDFSGSACEGYALQFRQVSELDIGEGKVIVSDLRATSWEDGAGKRLRFHSQNYFDETLRDSVDGQAERDGDGIAVELKEPGEKKLDLKNELVFPTEHVRRIIAAAREGKTLLQVSVYDGSDTGEKLYDTLTVIGKAIAPDEHKPDDAAAGQAAFAGMTRWPVTISYFDHAVAREDRRADAGLCHHLRALRERRVARAAARLRRFRSHRRDDVAGDQGRASPANRGSRALRTAVDPRLGQQCASGRLNRRVFLWFWASRPRRPSPSGRGP